MREDVWGIGVEVSLQYGMLQSNKLSVSRVLLDTVVQADLV